MNILYLTNHLNIGGISSYALTLAGGMKKRGHNVYIASSGGETVPRFTREGVEYIPIPLKTKSEVSYKILLSRFKLLKVIKEKNIDIIHANTRVTQVLSFLIQRACGRPYISTCHGFFKKRLFRRIFPCWGDKVIAISQSVKEHLIRDFKVNEADIIVIHSGIDINKFKAQSPEDKPDSKKKLGLKDAPVIGIVARLSEEKGHTYLIKAMQEVTANVPDAQLLIVGEGRTKEALVKLVKSLGLDKSVFIFPPVGDTQEVLSCMDLFVLPSLKEGLGLALMEAMACGIPAVGSGVGGIKSLIQDEINGLLVRPADSRELSRAILELLKNPDKAKSLGENARIFINQNFSQDRMVSQTEGVYLECLNVKY
ncbi:MAG: glycosyltransferase family 4 protein [Candidatus Omnitrophica bacterium]|nr:glycosyltransferase family 4 protein [Candidatus Omnitrophota bacterium]